MAAGISAANVVDGMDVGSVVMLVILAVVVASNVPF